MTKTSPSKIKPKILLVNEFSQLASGYATYGMEVMRRLYASGKYELAELACYTTHDDPKIQNVPWKVYVNYPDPQEVEEYNSKITNQFGEFTFEKTCLDFKPDIVFDIRDWWMCMDAYTPIITNSTVKDIQDIVPGDFVLTHQGRFRRVSKKFKRTYSGVMNKVYVRGCNIPLIITDGHPNLSSIRQSLSLPDFSKITPEWRNTENLKVGDFVCIPILNEVREEQTKHISEHLARLIGYYAAEGCIMYEGKSIEGVQLTFNSNEDIFIHDVINIFRTELGIEPKIQLKGNTAIIRIYSNHVGKFFQQCVPGLAATKYFTNFLITSPIHIRRQILCGLFRGDGGYYNKKATYCTKSRSLAFQVYHLCATLGIVPTFGLNKNKLYYRYLFTFANSNFQGFIAIYNNKNETIPVSKRIGNGYIWLTIKKIEKFKNTQIVHNFEVEEDNSYTSVWSLHNCEFEERSPFRPYYKWVLMPTVDATPQHEQWIATYMNADAVLTYSDWGTEVLKKEGGGLIKTEGSTPPGADLKTFHPMSRQELRQKFHFENDVNIIGTVMRNQERKLYPELIEAFALFQQQAPVGMAKKTYLYLHTTYPDQGWDIPRLIKKYGMSHKILVTYKCRKCHAVFPSFFMDVAGPCPDCGHATACMPNTQAGVDRYTLAKIFNLFDCYVQYANSEGFGIPMVEAASCGIPVFATDYSAMSDVVRKIRGYPIKVDRYRLDNNFGCYRAYPDNQDIVDKWIKFFSLPESERKRKGLQARQGVERYYTWEQTTNKWMQIFDKTLTTLFPSRENVSWDSPPKIHHPLPMTQEFANNEDFVHWAISNVLGQPELVNSYLSLRLIRDLNWGQTMTSLMGGNYANEQSLLATRGKLQSFTIDDAIRELYMMCENRNKWEQRRWDANTNDK